MGYCIFTSIDASLTQTQLTRSFEKSRTDVEFTAQATDVHKIPRPESRFVGRLEIPKLDVSSVVLEGVGSRTLRVGLGHVPGTSLPGQPGNVVIAGHRDTFFRPLRNIKIGDEVSVDTTAHTYCYQVRSFEIVDSRNVNALRFHNKNELTLITCYPFFLHRSCPETIRCPRRSSTCAREMLALVSYRRIRPNALTDDPPCVAASVDKSLSEAREIERGSVNKTLPSTCHRDKCQRA